MTAVGVESLVLAAAGAAMLACGVSRVRALLASPTAVRAGLAAALVAYGVAMMFDVAPVTRWVDRSVLDSPDVAILVSQVLTTVTAWCAIEMVAASAGRASAAGFRLRLTALVVASVWQCATFFVPSTPAPELSVVAFYLRTREMSQWQLYWISYGLISGAGSCYLALSSARYAGHATIWLRRGLLWVATGSIVCALFSASLAVSTFVALPPVAGFVQTIVVAVGGTLIGLGCVIPQVPDLRARRALLPMWRSATDLYPLVRMGRGRPDLRRVVTEIQDAVSSASDRDEVASPLMRALAALPARRADQYELTVADLCELSRRKLSPWWDEEMPTSTGPAGMTDNGER